MKKLLLLTSVCLLLVSSCKKVDLMEDQLIGRNKNAPELVEKLAGKNPHIPVDTTIAEVPVEECGEWIGEEWVITPCVETPESVPTETVTTEAVSEDCGYVDMEVWVSVPCDEVTTSGVVCPSVEYDIWAGAGGNDTTKATKAGTSTYTNDGTNLYITTTFSGPACPDELHVYAGANKPEVNGTGGLPFGNFPYKLSPADCGSHTFTIPLTDIFPNGDACGKDIYIVVHAAMGGDESEGGSAGQTAIAYGDDTFGGSRWGWSATYPVCCQVE